MDTSILGHTDQLTYDFASLTKSTVGSRDSQHPHPQLPVGTFVQGKYEIVGVLGHGGFAVVYDAQHRGLGRPVAIKVLHIGEETPVALLERFRREARLSALVRHPNVLEVYDVGQLDDGSPFLVMERLNGRNLSAWIHQGRMSIAAAVELGRQLAQGLAALGDAGIVHRDVKPDNLMLHTGPDDLPVLKLVDFGISKHMSIEPSPKLTCQGALVGTPQYMAPEQIRGEEVDPRSDVYAAGAVLYEALTGNPPHASDNFSELVVAVLNGSVEPISVMRPNCPIELERIILKALARDRSQRYASAHELGRALEAFARVYELPNGATAFADEASEQRISSIVMRASQPRIPMMGTLGLRQAKLPLQAACCAILALTPSLLLEMHPAVAAPSPAVHVQAPVSSGPAVLASNLVPIGVPEPDVESARPVAVRALRPRATPIADSAPSADTNWVSISPSAATDALPIAPEPPVPESKVRAAAPPISKAKTVVVEKSKPAPLMSASQAPAMPVSLEPAQPLTPQQRGAWERVMQSALSAMIRGQLNAAKLAYAEATRMAPQEPAGFRGLGLVSARLGEPVAARNALRRYLALAPNAPDAAAIAARIVTAN